MKGDKPRALLIHIKNLWLTKKENLNSINFWNEWIKMINMEIKSWGFVVIGKFIYNFESLKNKNEK